MVPDDFTGKLTGETVDRHDFDIRVEKEAIDQIALFALDHAAAPGELHQGESGCYTDVQPLGCLIEQTPAIVDAPFLSRNEGCEAAGVPESSIRSIRHGLRLPKLLLVDRR